MPGGILAAAGINSGLNALYTWQFAELLVGLFDDDASAEVPNYPSSPARSAACGRSHAASPT